MVAVDGSDPVSDPVSGRWFGEHDACWALQRPDVHLHGTATDAAGAGRLLTDRRCRPTPEPNSNPTRKMRKTAR